MKKEGQKYGYDSEAFAIFDTIQYVKPPVHTVAIGTAWGEAAMLLAAGKKVLISFIPFFLMKFFVGSKGSTFFC